MNKPKGTKIFSLATFRFRSTRNIRKPGDVGNLNFCTFTQIVAV